MKIHKHPQKAEYASPAEWPTVSSQGHWQPAIDPMNPTIGHIHFDLTAPLYAEVKEPFECPFSIHLFHVKGKATFTIARTELVKEIIWDGGKAPEMIGDPSGEKIWNGKLVINPMMAAGHPAPPKGFFIAIIQTTLAFDNGDAAVLEIQPEFYSMIDPMAEERYSPVYFGSHFSPFSSRTNIVWGVNLVDIYGYIPIAPIDKPWRIDIGTAGYGARDLGPATYESRLDLDLHHDVPGKLLDTVTLVGDINRAAIIDPAVLGMGLHKIAFFRIQPDNKEIAATLSVIKVPVGVSLPPPPEEPPPPHEHEVWTVITPVFKQLFIDGVPQNRYQISTMAGFKEI